MVIDKGKQKEVIQDEEVLLYKSHAILLEPSRPTTSESILLQKEIDKLKKALNMVQSPTKTILFLLPAHYKTLWQDGEKNM